MVAKTQFSDDELRFMLSHYNLGTFVDAQPIASGTVQTVLRLESTAGTFIVKYYENRSPRSVGYETNLLVYINKYDFPCVPPVRNRNQGYYAIYKNKPFVFYPYVEGDLIEELQPYHQEQIIKVAAALQNYTRNYLPQNRHDRWNYTIGFCQQLLSQCRSTITDARFIAKADWYQQQLDKLDIHKTPKGICHCDYDHTNILWQNDQLLALIDFDDANTTHINMDLIYLLDMWAWSDDTFDFEEATHIIDLYATSRKLTVLERKYFYDIHKLKVLIDSIWFFHVGDPHDFPALRTMDALETIGYEKYTRRLFGANYIR
ncbi:MAG: phosphotransferase [Chloroflexota bacterium]